MRALIFNSELKLAEIPKPKSTKNESLIRILKAGICNTDLELTKGYMGFNGVLGHEFIGIVEESAENSLIGKRVVGEINAGCGTCQLCLNGDPRHCINRTVLGIFKRDGAFANYTTLPNKNLLIVPDSVTNEAAVFTEPLAAAIHVYDELSVQDVSNIAIIGDGKLGLLIALAGQAVGKQIVLIGQDKDHLLRAKSFGIEVYHTDEKITKKFDIAVECSGHRTGMVEAFNVLNPLGTLILKSTYAVDSSLDLSPAVIHEITIKGSRCGRFQPAIDMLADNKIDTSLFISANYTLEHGIEAFVHAAHPGTLKVFLDISNE